MLIFQLIVWIDTNLPLFIFLMYFNNFARKPVRSPVINTLLNFSSLSLRLILLNITWFLFYIKLSVQLLGVVSDL